MVKAGNKHAGPWLKGNFGAGKKVGSANFRGANGLTKNGGGQINTFRQSAQKFLNETGRNMGITPKAFTILLEKYKTSELLRKEMERVQDKRMDIPRSAEIRIIAEVLTKEVNLPYARVYAFASWLTEAKKLTGYE